MGTDADQAEGPAIGFVDEQGFGGLEHLFRWTAWRFSGGGGRVTMRKSAVLSLSVIPLLAKPVFFIRRATVSASCHRIGRSRSSSAVSLSRVVSDDRLLALPSGSTRRSRWPSSSAGSFRNEPERVCPQPGREAAKGAGSRSIPTPRGFRWPKQCTRTSRCRSETSARCCASLAQHFTAGSPPNSSKPPLRSGLSL